MYNFTPEDLLQYHYNELTAEESKLLEASVQDDWVLREKLSVIREAAQRLNKSLYSPRQEAINEIMQYARKTFVHAEG